MQPAHFLLLFHATHLQHTIYQLTLSADACLSSSTTPETTASTVDAAGMQSPKKKKKRSPSLSDCSPSYSCCNQLSVRLTLVLPAQSFRCPRHVFVVRHWCRRRLMGLPHGLRLKVCQLTRPTHCASVQHSLSSPPAYAYDQAHVLSSSVGANIGESVAGVRLPAYMSSVRALAVTFTSRRDEPTSFPLALHAEDERLSVDCATVCAASTPPTNEAVNEHSVTGNRSKRRRTVWVALASLSELRTLILLELRCGGHSLLRTSAMSGASPTEQSVAFHSLPRLETLVLTGSVGSHCLSLLLTIPVQCPGLSFIDLQALSIASDQSQSDLSKDGATETPSSSPLLLPFVQWLPCVKHLLQ